VLRDAIEPIEGACGITAVTCPHRITCTPYTIAGLDWRFAFCICRGRYTSSYPYFLFTEEFILERIPAKEERRMKHVKLLLLILFIGVSAPLLFLWGREQKSISLEEVLSIGSLDDDALYMWVGVTTDSKGNIYLTDSMDYSVKKFNDRGLLVKKAGRKGQGPGEFLAVRLIKYFNGFLYVTDQNRPGIQVFDEDLNYKKHIPFNTQIWDMSILSENKIFISAPFIAKPEKIMLIDLEGNSKVDMSYFLGKQDYWLNFRKFDADNQGNFYVIYTFEDRIERFNKNLRKIWSKSLSGKKRAKRKKTEIMFGVSLLPTEIVYKDIALDSSGNLFILGGNTSKNPGRDVYVLDEDGNHLLTFTLPEPSHCIHLDSHNFLYSRAGQGVTLKKYYLKSAFK
jgi:outer membrane protein assembly factor BamB